MKNSQENKCDWNSLNLEQSYIDRDRKEKEKAIISEQKKRYTLDFYSWRRDKYDNFVQYNQDEGEQVTDQKRIRQFIDIEVKVMKNRQFFQKKKVELWKQSFKKLWDNPKQLDEQKLKEQKRLIREEEHKALSDQFFTRKKQLEDGFQRDKAAKLQKWQKENLKSLKQKIKKQYQQEFMQKAKSQMHISILEQKQKNQALELRKQQLKEEIKRMKQKHDEYETILNLSDQNLAQTKEKFNTTTKQILELIDKQIAQLPQLRQFFDQNDIVPQQFEGFDEELEYVKEQVSYIFHFIHRQKRELRKMDEYKNKSAKTEKLIQPNHKNGKKR